MEKNRAMEFLSILQENGMKEIGQMVSNKAMEK